MPNIKPTQALKLALEAAYVCVSKGIQIIYPLFVRSFTPRVHAHSHQPWTVSTVHWREG